MPVENQMSHSSSRHGRMPKLTQITGALYQTVDVAGLWHSSITQGAETRHEASDCELTTYVNLSSMPEGTRLIIRREPPTPRGPAQSLCQPQVPLLGLLLRRRGRPGRTRRDDASPRGGRESHPTLKGVRTQPVYPSSASKPVATGSSASLRADVVRWFQLLSLTGTWKEARPKALRAEIFHAPGRLV